MHLVWWLVYVGRHNSVENLSNVSNQIIVSLQSNVSEDVYTGTLVC